MHCPNCGKQTSIDQKFCKSCGMSLATVSIAIASHQSGLDSGKRPVSDDAGAIRRMAIMLFWGIVVFIMGGVALGISKRVLPNDFFVGLIGVVLLVAGLILAMYAVISPMWRQADKPGQKPETKRARESENSRDTLPEGLTSPPSSITEGTTNILETDAAAPMSSDTSKEPGA